MADEYPKTLSIPEAGKRYYRAQPKRLLRRRRARRHSVHPNRQAQARADPSHGAQAQRGRSTRFLKQAGSRKSPAFFIPAQAQLPACIRIICNSAAIGRRNQAPAKSDRFSWRRNRPGPTTET